MPEETAKLRILTTTALGALPVPDTVVTVSNERHELLYALITDQGGATPPLTLPTPPRAESLQPGDAQPFSIYVVQADHPDYVPLAALKVPLFAGIDALLPIQLTPLPENEPIAPQQFTATEPPQTLASEEG